MEHPNNDLMRICIENARKAAKLKQYALGTLVVDENGSVLSAQYSRLISDYDPTGHPEIVAIREAAVKIQSRYLPGCFLYSTFEPCPMCTSAAIWAKMAGIVFGALQEDGANFSARHPSEVYTWRNISIPSQYVVDHGTPKLQIYPGFMREECRALFNLSHNP